MYATSDFKKGLKILIEGEPYSIVDFQHIKPGKGNQFTRTKLRHLISGTNLERTIKSGEKFDIPDVEYTEMDFLYADDTGYNFMSQTTFEQYSLTKDVLGDSVNFLLENMKLTVVLYNERAVAVELPNTVILEVTATDPGLKGNTVSNTFKPATVSTGYTLQVPLHTKVGDNLKIDTRTGEYLERVNKK